MKKLFLSIAILTTSVCMMASCGNKAANTGSESAEAAVEAADDNSPAMQLLNSVDFTEEGLKSMIKTPEKEPLTADEFEALYLAYSKVDLKDNLELGQNFVGKVKNAVLSNHKRPANASEIFQKLLSNASPQVRGVAVQQFKTIFGVNDGDISKLVQILNNEKAPYVIKEGIKTLSNEMKKPEVAKFILSQISSDNKYIRKAVALSVGNYWSKGVDGMADAAKKLMADSDEDVQKTILSHVGELSDDSLVPELEKVLNDPAQAKLHGDAMRSLYTMWYGYPKHENTSKAAYTVALNYLKKTPRTNDIPAWTSIGALETQNAKEINGWKARATYYKDAEWVKVMMDIATDANANWIGRTSAVKVIAKIGSKSDLEKVKSAVAGNSSDKSQKQVLDAVNKAIDKL